MAARLVAVVCLFTAFASAANITPEDPSVPLGGSQAPGVWYVDRYAPAIFRDASGYKGQPQVIEVGVSGADQDGSRPPSYSGMFYNTQGRKYDITGGSGDFIRYSLFIDSEWENPTNGFVRTDVWTTMANAQNGISAYPTIGFTNYGSSPRYRYWSSTDWVDLQIPVLYDAWTSFRIELAGQDIVYAINGVDVGTISGTGTTKFLNVMLQAYNFGDDFNTATSVNNPAAYTYSAYWSSAVPEPGTWLLIGCGLVGLGWRARRRRS